MAELVKGEKVEREVVFDTETCDVSNTKGAKNTKAHDHGLSVSNESDVSRISVDAINKISELGDLSV
jgi:hypothetical protein